MRRHRGLTLIEVSLVVALLAVISAMTMPALLAQMRQRQLPASCRRLGSLITLVRVNAQFDGKRYRLRFPSEDDLEEMEWIKDDRQPLIEREDDPIEEPEVWNVVFDPWAHGETLLGDVRCAEVRLGKPTIERLQDDRERDTVADLLEEAFDDIDPIRPPLIFETDGTCEWATFVMTTAPPDLEYDELEDEPRINLVLEGMTGLTWLQRPFYDEELDLFEEKGWPAVFRQDHLDPGVLDEDDVLELHERRIGALQEADSE